MLLIGIDLGTSSVKVSVVDALTRTCITSARYPEREVDIIAPQPGWAEQEPQGWWEHVCGAILQCHSTGLYDPKAIGAIGISYQMHGLVLVDKRGEVLYNAIIWCDGRAVAIGEAAFEAIGDERCLSRLLNSPGNFTASKLAWIKEKRPEVFAKVDKVLLPGDFIAMKFTGEATTTVSALSEGVFWDFTEGTLSSDVMEYYGFEPALIPDVQPLFGPHGYLQKRVADLLSLREGIPVSYKAGDQLNNAFSLNVLQPGEVAATAGTSGVIYGVSDQTFFDPRSRINSFAHVNHTNTDPRIGVLLCINGAGIFNRWVRNAVGPQQSYDNLNAAAGSIAPGSDGLVMLPFGNGPERMLNNQALGAQVHSLDFNLHTPAHLVRAAQEGIAFSFRYGLDIMREGGMSPSVIRAGRANMFLSEVFLESFVGATGVPVELYETDGSVGAALGAGVGTGFFPDAGAAFAESKPLRLVEPKRETGYERLYQKWKKILTDQYMKQPAAYSTADL